MLNRVVRLSLVEKMTLSKDLMELKEGIVQVPGEGHSFRQGNRQCKAYHRSRLALCRSARRLVGQEAEREVGVGLVRADKVLGVAEGQVLQPYRLPGAAWKRGPQGVT